MNKNLRILLITWYRNYNYGTALQAYALKSIIEDPSITGLMSKDAFWKCKCELLPHIPCPQRKRGKWKKLFIPRTYFSKLNDLMDKKIYNHNKALFLKREKTFDDFVIQNFVFAADHNIQNEEELRQIAQSYDIILAGSDQIWNPVSLDPLYLLQSISAEKKMSYGSSLSVQEIKPVDEPIYRQSLSTFKAISIRDRKCRAQLETIVGKPIATVVDPVILLGRNALIQSAQEIISDPYIFCYFLGSKKEHRLFAASEAKKRNLQIHAVINVGSNYSADRPLKSVADWDVDPWKFVGYIKNASLVITDSFHATVIATLCHTQFIVLEKDSKRPEQNNRILEFLDSTGLIDRWEQKDINHVINEKQWLQSDRALMKMRKKSFNWLISNL